MLFRSFILTVIILVSFFIGWFNISSEQIFGFHPAPTEYQQHKEKRKEFKKLRKAYMEQMHRAHPDTDWKSMDENTRREKALAKTDLRRSVYNSSSSGESKTARFSDRDVVGSWAEKGSNNLSGRIHTAEIDWENGMIYCGSSGGNIWRGTIYGTDWESMNDYFQIPDIKMLRFVERGPDRRLLIGSGGKRFYYSNDDGFTINQAQGLDNLQNWGWVVRTIVKNDPLQTIYLLAVEWDYNAWQEITTLHKSVDLGESFQQVHTLTETLSGSFDIWQSRYGNSEVYLLNDNNLYIIDENDNLVFISNLNVNSSGSSILIGGEDNGALFLYARVGSDIYYSPNGGNSWQYKGAQPSGTFSNNSFNCSNLSSQHVYIGSVDLYRSVNGANSWQMVNNWWEYYGQEATKLHADIPEVRFFVDPEGIEHAYISTDGGLYHSGDYIQTVANLSLNGLGVSQYYSTYTSRSYPHNVFAGSQDQGYQRSLNDQGGILDFEQVISGDYGHLVSGDGGESIWCDYPGFVLHYPDAAGNSNGATWDFVGSGFLWIPPVIADPLDPDVAYVAGGGEGGNYLIRLQASGNSISHTQMAHDFPYQLSGLAISPIDYAYWYTISSNGHFYYSTDAGETWDESNTFTGLESHYFYGSAVYASQTNLGVVYIAGSGYSNPPVYMSNDHGENFHSMSSGMPSTLVFELAGTPEETFLFAATEVGPYAYSAEENQWYDIAGVFAPDQTYWTVDYIPEMNTARFGTYGRGIWDFTLDDNYWIVAGDVNFDDIINVLDIISVINIILENIEPTDEMLLAADLNGDDIVNIQDIILIVQLILHN